MIPAVSTPDAAAVRSAAAAARARREVWFSKPAADVSKARVSVGNNIPPETSTPTEAVADVYDTPRPRLVPTDAPIAMAGRITVQAVLHVVARHYGVPAAEITGRCRKANVTRARHVTFFCSRELTRLSFPDLGRRLGGFDHSSLVFAYQKVQRALDAGDAATVSAIEAIKVRLGMKGITPRELAQKLAP